MTQLVNANKFFAYARERYRIKLKRDAGQSWPWTTDPHLREWRFTNIFREDDRTTQWFKENVREPLSKRFLEDPTELNRNHIVESTIIFRWINRIQSGEEIKDLLLDKWDSKEAFRRLDKLDVVFTGAFIVVGEPYQSKLSGVLAAIDNARPYLPLMVPLWGKTLEGAWKDLITIPYIGGFGAHEIVQDLNYTPILDKAVDDCSWSHMGPGATRGMSWLVYGHGDGFANSSSGQKKMLELAIELLEMSRINENWPDEYPRWRLHQVEFTLCEIAKMFRAHGGHRQKRRYQQ